MFITILLDYLLSEFTCDIVLSFRSVLTNLYVYFWLLSSVRENFAKIVCITFIFNHLHTVFKLLKSYANVYILYIIDLLYIDRN